MTKLSDATLSISAPAASLSLTDPPTRPWYREPWPWLLALIVAGTMRDLRSVGYEATDMVINWAFVGFTVWIGRMVHRRTAQADALATQLQRTLVMLQHEQ